MRWNTALAKNAMYHGWTEDGFVRRCGKDIFVQLTRARKRAAIEDVVFQNEVCPNDKAFHNEDWALLRVHL